MQSPSEFCLLAVHHSDSFCQSRVERGEQILGKLEALSCHFPQQDMSCLWQADFQQVHSDIETEQLLVQLGTSM